MSRAVPPIAWIGLGITAAIDLGLALMTSQALMTPAKDHVANSLMTPPPVMSSGVTPRTGQPLDAYAATMRRPLFEKTRSPFIAPQPAAPAAAVAQSIVMAEPTVVMSGYLLTEHGKRAFLATTADRQGQWVTEGAEFLGWHLKSVQSNRAVLEKAGKTQVVVMFPEQ